MPNYSILMLILFLKNNYILKKKNLIQKKKTLKTFSSSGVLKCMYFMYELNL